MSDPGKKVAQAYGVLSPRGFASRITIYIDKDGKVAYIDDKVKAREDGATVAARLEELKVERAQPE